MYCGFIWIHFFHVHKSLQKCRLFISSGFIEKKLKRKTKCCPVLQSPEVWSYWLRWVLKQTAEVWKNKAKLGWLYLDQSDWCRIRIRSRTSSSAGSGLERTPWTSASCGQSAAGWWEHRWLEAAVGTHCKERRMEKNNNTEKGDFKTLSSVNECF